MSRTRLYLAITILLGAAIGFTFGHCTVVYAQSEATAAEANANASEGELRLMYALNAYEEAFETQAGALDEAKADAIDKERIKESPGTAKAGNTDADWNVNDPLRAGSQSKDASALNQGESEEGNSSDVNAAGTISSGADGSASATNSATDTLSPSESETGSSSDSGLNNGSDIQSSADAAAKAAAEAAAAAAAIALEEMQAALQDPTSAEYAARVADEASRRGIFARFAVPELGIDVAVFYTTDLSNLQSIVDADDSACLFYWLDGNYILADHNTQGFENFQYYMPDTAYMVTPNGYYTYTCIESIPYGWNMGSYLAYADGTPIGHYDLVTYTCNSDSSVTINGWSLK